MTEKRNQEYLYKHEREAQERRRRIAAAIACGWTYEKIRRELGASTSTISAVKKMMKEDDREW